MNPMITAPKDGTRILLHYYVHHYTDFGWERVGSKWEEFRWTPFSSAPSSEPRWEPWCGDNLIHSTQRVRDEDCIGWLPLPE